MRKRRVTPFGKLPLAPCEPPVSVSELRETIAQLEEALAAEREAHAKTKRTVELERSARIKEQNLLHDLLFKDHDLDDGKLRPFYTGGTVTGRTVDPNPPIPQSLPKRAISGGGPRYGKTLAEAAARATTAFADAFKPLAAAAPATALTMKKLTSAMEQMKDQPVLHFDYEMSVGDWEKRFAEALGTKRKYKTYVFDSIPIIESPLAHKTKWSLVNGDVHKGFEQWRDGKKGSKR